MTALATTEKTPIMLSSHTYLNLDGFQNPQTSLVTNHSLYMPYAGQRVAIDNIEVPTGDILANQEGCVYDFWSEPKQIGANLSSPDLTGGCGYNCTGYDTCFVLNRDAQLDFSYDWHQAPVATLASQWSGIQLDIYTNQHALQVYSCNNMNGALKFREYPDGGTNNWQARSPSSRHKASSVSLLILAWLKNTAALFWKSKTGLTALTSLHGAGTIYRYMALTMVRTSWKLYMISRGQAMSLASVHDS